MPVARRHTADNSLFQLLHFKFLLLQCFISEKNGLIDGGKGNRSCPNTRWIDNCTTTSCACVYMYMYSICVYGYGGVFTHVYTYGIVLTLRVYMYMCVLP